MTGAEQERVKPIVELFRPDCVAFWATTYNIDLAFFNEYLLRRLGDQPLNAVVIADQDCLDTSLERSLDRLDLLTTVNRRWLLRGVRLGNGRFHPKSYLTVTGRTATLLVGSGNLSTNGIDNGREVFVTFRSGTPAGDTAIDTWRTWMRRLVTMIGDARLAERFTDLELRLPTPSGPRPVVDSPLLHNLVTSLADQLVAAIGERSVGELIVTAPFYDEHGEALGRLVDRLHPDRLTLYTTSSTSVDGARLRDRLERTGAAIEIYAYMPDKFTHAKLIGAIAGDTGWIFSGSANLSHAALTLTADQGNVEFAVLGTTTPDLVRDLFLPPDTTIEPRPLAALVALTYLSVDDTSKAIGIRLVSATLTADDRLQIATNSPIDPTWRLADHENSHGLDVIGAVVTTTGALSGPLVRLINDRAEPVSNWCVIEDPVALAQILRAGDHSSQTSRPAELTTADLDTPLGRALLMMHRDMVMDVSERAPVAGAGEIGEHEASAAETDDDVWQRLEREILERDPRAASYARLLGQSTNSVEALGEPLVELLDAMRHRVPLTDPHGNRRTLLQVLALAPNVDRDAAPSGQRWSEAARVRVRARNVLRRWAAAQTDPRLAFIDPLAPLGNLLVISTIFLTLWPYALGTADGPAELDANDLDELWASWFRPFVGTGHNNGWLDRIDTTTDRVSTLLHDQLAKNITALCWLAIRPGSERRTRIVAWQPTLRAAFDAGLINDTDDVAEYLSRATDRPVTTSQVGSDLAESLTFIDDDLWCAETARELDLPRVALGILSAGQDVSVRLDVGGVADPLLDPRVPQLVVAVRSYRSTDAVAIYSGDHDWRMVFDADEPIIYKQNAYADIIESGPSAPGDIDRIVADQGVLADLFPRSARVA